MTSREFWRQQLKLRQFGLEYDRPRDFVTLQWGVERCYLWWTIGWTIYHLIWLSLEVFWWSAKDYSLGYWLIYFTNICYLMLCILTFTQCAIAVYTRLMRRDVLEGKSTTMPWFLKLEWVLLNLTNASAMLITFTYWTMIRDTVRPWTVNKHGINLFHVLLMLIVTRKPIKFQHVYIPMLYSFCYMMIHLINYVISGYTVYSFLKWWESPVKSVLLAILYVFVLTPLTHLIIYGIFRLKLYILEKYLPKRDSKDLETSDEEVKTGMMKNIGGEKSEEK